MLNHMTSALPACPMPEWRLSAALGVSGLPIAARIRAAHGAELAAKGKAAKPAAPSGAPAHAYVVSAEQHINGRREQSALTVPVMAESFVGYGSTSALQDQTQLNVVATRVDGHAGSPPRGRPA